MQNRVPIALMTEVRALSILILAFSLFLGITKVYEPDTFWHIRTGQLIIDSGRVPRVDAFSLDGEGKTWVAYSWLADVIFFLTYRAGGFDALTFLKAFVVSAAFLAVFRTCIASGISPSFGAFFVICFLLAGSFRFTERPHIFSLFFLAIFSFLLAGEKGSRMFSLYLLPPLSFIWANIHPGVMFGIALLFIHCCSSLLESLALGTARRSGRNISETRHLLIASLLSFLASAINPMGLRLYAFSIAQSKVAEYTPVKEFFPLLATDTVFHAVFTASLLIAVIVSIRRRTFDEIAVSLVFGGLALLFRRMLPEFFTAAGATLIGALQDISAPFHKKIGTRLSSALRLSPILLVLLSGYWVSQTDYIQLHGPGSLNFFFPKKAIEFIRSHGLRGRMYNSANFGGAVILIGYPEIKPFWDTRNELHEGSLREVHASLSSPDLFASFLDKYGFDLALIEPYHKYIKTGFFTGKNWALIYWDDIAMVLVKRSKDHAKIIRTFEYRVLNPEDAYEMMPRIISDQSWKISAERELRRCLRSNPETSRARVLLGLILSSESRWEEAEDEFIQALKIQPYSFTANYEAARYFSLRGRYRAALTPLKRAISLAPVYRIQGPALDRLYDEERLLAAMKNKVER